MRAEFWRQQKPMYARHRDRERQARARQSHRPPKDAMAKVIRNLEEIDEGSFSDGVRVCCWNELHFYFFPNLFLHFAVQVF